MDLRSMTIQLRDGAMSIERCMEQIEGGKRAEALLPNLINKQATLALSIKYWSERETDRAMPIDEFVDKLTEYMKEANKND